MSSLAGTWQAVKGDLVTAADATIPGKFTGSHLRRTLELPADWRGKTVFLHFESAEQWVGSVVVNGRPINYNGYLHPAIPVLPPTRRLLWRTATVSSSFSGRSINVHGNKGNVEHGLAGYEVADRLVTRNEINGVVQRSDGNVGSSQ